MTLYEWGENAQKCTQKKEFCNTITRRSKNLDFPGKTEFVDTITRARKYHQKYTENANKKEMLYQDISDTLKRELLKNTNIREIYAKNRADRQDTGQAEGVSFIFLVPKRNQSFRSP